MQRLLDDYSGLPLWLQSLIALCALAVAALTVNWLLKKVLLRIAAPYLDARSDTVDRSAAWLTTVIPLLLVSRGIGLVPHLPEEVVNVTVNIARTMIVLSIAMAIGGALDYANELYSRRPESRSRPIKGYVQVVKIAIYFGAAILMIAVLIEQSPLLLLSGLGAMAAVLMLVFKDTILSLVASVQLSSNDMLRVGDWIEMPGMNADGDVVDIALHTVKIRNFDKTITTIPTHRLIADSFRNWRGMNESGGRRIKRALVVDQNSIRFLDDKETDDLKRFRLLDDYLASKQEEIAEWNRHELSSDCDTINARRITNIGTLRAYVIAYLKSHPRIAGAGFTLMVRQLPPGPQGLLLHRHGGVAAVRSDPGRHLRSYAGHPARVRPAHLPASERAGLRAACDQGRIGNAPEARWLSGAAHDPVKGYAVSGGFRLFVRVAQHIAAAPYGLDVIFAAAGMAELLAQLADEDVDDLEFGFVHAAVKVVEEHFLGQRGALAERKQLQHGVFLAGEVNAGAIDFDGLGVEVDGQLAGTDDRLAVSLGATHHGVNAGDQFFAVEGLGHVIVGTEAERADLAVHFGNARKDQDRRLHLGDAEFLEHVVTVHVGQVQIEQDDVVIIQLAEIQAFFAEVGRVDIEAFGREHELDGLGRCRLVFDQQYTHWDVPRWFPSVRR